MYKWLIVMVMVAIGVGSVACAQEADEKASPFERIRWVDDEPEVLVGGVWYKAITIDGVEVAEVLEFCDGRWPGMMRKRFGEDLVEAMRLMGHAPNRLVDLGVMRVSDNERMELSDVAMTKANRRSILHDSNGRPVPKIVPEYVSRDQAYEDIDRFCEGLREQFAYLDLKGVDLEGEIAVIKEGLGERVATGDLAGVLHRLLMRFGDGHARVSSQYMKRPGMYPPFLLAEAGGGVVAFAADRGGFVDEDYPYLVEIDGKAIDEWVEAASTTVAAGSDGLVRYRALRGVRSLELLRVELGLAESSRVVCKLAKDPEGGETTEVVLSMNEHRPIYGSWPRTETRVLEGEIGYLRLEQMRDDLVPHLRMAMKSFRDTRGLIVDVRGNSGGTRSLLTAFAGYLVADGQGAWVGNVARYRLSDRFSEDHLEARSMYRADDPRWSERQRLAVESFAADFEAEWSPDGAFSDWHYLVLDRTGHADEFYYGQPVVILSDAGCFSATDIFLGALSGRSNVTLMGGASGGGSARVQGFELPNTSISVRCASMVSYQPNGRLYDGRGVEVDVEVPAAPMDYLVGGSDTVLEAGIEWILESLDGP